jgi:inner membrane protein
MPTIFTHALTAAALGQWVPPRLREEMARAARGLAWTARRFWLWSAVCAMLPDADVIGFGFGIRYGDVLGHRGFTHSLLFAALAGGIVARVVDASPRAPRERRRTRRVLTIYFALVIASHGVLDALTNGGLGIAFFSPFDTTRYFFPWRPIAVSPIGARFFSERGLNVLLSELQWIWVPSILVAAAAWLWRSRGGKQPITDPRNLISDEPTSVR